MGKSKFPFWVASIFFLSFAVWAEGLVFSKKQIREMVEFTRTLAQRGITQGEVFTPPGESTAIVWDSSGTTQFYYKKFFGISIPRDSFAQYRMVKKNLWFPASFDSEGWVSEPELEKKLQIGDLLFWSNTHNQIPKDRNPPVSHVMIYVGKSKTGKFLMVGAGTKGNGETTSLGGVDLYVFDPNKIMGCVSSETGECIENSQFLGNGRLK